MAAPEFFSFPFWTGAGLPVLLYSIRQRMGPRATQVAARVLNPELQWYIRPDITSECFLIRLRELGVSYVVLGGGGLVPCASPDQTLEILVADEHIPVLKSFLCDWPVGQPCNVYSATGFSGFMYRFQAARAEVADKDVNFPGDMAVFPPYLASRILERAIPQSDGLVLPEPEDHFFASVYRAVYLEGTQSGLRSEFDPEPSATGPAAGPQERMLTDLADAVGIDLTRPLTLEALDEMLARSGWRPPRDVLERLSVCHPWIRRKFFAPSQDHEADSPGVAVFFIRERAVEAGLGPRVAELIESAGFEILSALDLEGERRDEVARAVRGGNWGPGDFPVCGGRPASALVALDVIPRGVSSAEQRYHPALDNARLLYAKQAVRTPINEELPPPLRYNPVHSTDNSRDAWHVIGRLLPQQEVDLREVVRQRRASFATREEVVADLTRWGDRAKIELIRYGEQLAVKKTFRHHKLRFLQREIEFYQEFSHERNEIVPILEKGWNYFITPFLENKYTHLSILGAQIPRLLPLRAVRQLADFLNHALARGYDLVDVSPFNNVLIGDAGEIRLVDFEFVHRRGEPVTISEQSFCLAGVPERFEGDLPVLTPPHFRDPYPTLWYPYTGLSMDSLLHDPPWLQSVRRLVNYPSYLLVRGLRTSIYSERLGAVALKRWCRRRIAGLLRRLLRPVTRAVIHGRHAGLSATARVLRGVAPGRPRSRTLAPAARAEDAGSGDTVARCSREAHGGRGEWA